MVLRKPSIHMLVWLLMYADDITLICHSAEDMSNMAIQVHHIMSQWGMSVSVKKSKLMVVSRDKDVQVPTVTIDGSPLEVVDSFVCLGSKFTRDNSIEAEVSFRISRACAAFANLKQVFCGHRYISIGTKVKIFNATVMASLLYGCEAWALTEKQINRLEVFQMQCLRNICGLKLLDRIENDVIRAKCKQVKVDVQLRYHRLRWLGHLVRMSDDRIPKRMLFSFVEGHRPRGRPRAKWAGLLINDLQVVRDLKLLVGREQWYEQCIDKNRWRAMLQKYVDC